jgi:sporulation protein YunB
MQKGKKRNINSILLRWLCLLLAFSVILGYIYYKMQSVIIKYAESVAETTMLNSANEAIVNILDSEKVDYNDIVTLSRNTEGLVTSLETNAYKTNYLKSNISNEISRIIENRERYVVGIPIGTFLANTYTAGLGPDLKFKMQITTTAFADFEDEFVSAGINQVLHSVKIKIKINGTILVAGYKKTISVSTTAIVAQTVIVGFVPDSFTNVIEEESDNTAGLINDYGSITGGQNGY